MGMVWPYSGIDHITENVTADGTTYYSGTIVLIWFKLLMKW